MSMANQMFCFQCEQTARGSGCGYPGGVCGKSAPVALLQDQLTAAMIMLAKTAHNYPRPIAHHTYELLMRGLFTTVTNVNFDGTSIKALINDVRREHDHFWPAALGPVFCKKPVEYSMQSLWRAEENLRSLKSLLLFGLRGMAAYAYHANILGYSHPEVNRFFLNGLYLVGYENRGEVLLEALMKLGELNIRCMAMLEEANIVTYGIPEPTKVPLTIEPGPLIVVSGHDFNDLELLLRQTEHCGINIYTHGEMLPAHSYPKLKQYPHLKGHFGTAWQNQQKEFAQLPAPILFTTNCLMPPKSIYADRVFTSGVVSYPDIAHIDDHKDFRPIIQKALQLKGFSYPFHCRGNNGGDQLWTGFSYRTLLKIKNDIVENIKNGSIRHIYLIGGCDGAKAGRNYFTSFVKKLPQDTLILTLACGKFRFNDLDLGDINGIPRLLDLGQCNDAYGAIQLALALADALACSVNQLPFSIVLSWYEQKAVCVLLSLLSLGIQNILLGPDLPAFLSPGILRILRNGYGLDVISDPDSDIEKLNGQKA